MKKVLAIALAALGITTAQALTVSWNNKTATGNVQSGDLSSTISMAEKISITYIVDSSVDIFEGNGFNAGQTIDVLSVKSAADATDGLTLRFKKSGGWHLGFAINGNEIFQNKLEGAISGNLKVIFNADIVDGKYTNMSWAWSAIGSGTITATNYNGLYAAPESLTYVEGHSLIKNVTSSVTVGVVPEPTALALLALGVAGLALKRKVA